MLFFYCFKQKTAYEMRISDWSSDVCSSDLTFRSTFSLWDTFRAQHPLLTLVVPDQTNSDIVKSLVASRKASPHGILPVWQFHGRETWTMIGYHAVPVIADAYLKGVGDFDANEALDAMVASAEYAPRSEEHTSELQSLMRISYAVFCLKIKN